MEAKFSESLRLLGGYVKSKIQGRGMIAVTQIMNAADQSHAPRLTNYNHEEEHKRQELLTTAINESVKIATEAAKMLAEEEANYVRTVFAAEQARIAAEIELKRRADEEALKILVERAMRIAEVESQKLAEDQEMGPQQDTNMNDQDLDEQASDRGKTVVVDTTPPHYPIRLIVGSPSSAIPPAVQVALDELKSEMKDVISKGQEDTRNEFDELRADLRADMNTSGDATQKKIDEMMVFLQKIASH
ncbi:hypothetical protein QL285_038939 [Trifolium repens]|nr:hypothetical protein QL285_038939 [Trifolium repens]